MQQEAIAKWHDIIQSGDMSKLDTILSDDATFHSPIVFSTQEGKEITALYLKAASHVLGGENFRYVREILDGNDAVLEFEAEIEGIYVNGVDMIHINDRGQVDDFKVMVRPLKAINLIHKKMGEMLQQMTENA